MQKLIITKGLPGSGKTTWAKAEMAKHPKKYIRLNRDEFRRACLSADTGFSSLTEKFITDLQITSIKNLIGSAFDIIIDDTNLNPKTIKGLQDACGNMYDVVIQDFTNVPVYECIARDLKREFSVGAKVIYKMYAKYLAPLRVSANNNVPIGYVREKAVICDIDGTLADLSDRDPMRTDLSDSDTPNPAILEILNRFKADYKLIFITGRHEKYKLITEQFISKCGITDYLLFMREAALPDLEDAVLKQDIYFSHVHPFFDVLFVLEDRARVVDMWRSTGLKTLQVDEGAF